MIRPLRSLCPLCPLAFLAACAFNSPDVEDAPPGGDDSGRGGGWTTVEELTVPSSGVPVMSQVPLQVGVPYRLRASGTFYVKLATLADAEYYNFNNGTTTDGESGIDVGLAVNDPIIDATRRPRWGTYSDTHVYEVEWMGEGQQITVQLHDGNYLNNIGELKLAILAPR